MELGLHTKIVPLFEPWAYVFSNAWNTEPGKTGVKGKCHACSGTGLVPIALGAHGLVAVFLFYRFLFTGHGCRRMFRRRFRNSHIHRDFLR